MTVVLHFVTWSSLLARIEGFLPYPAAASSLRTLWNLKLAVAAAEICMLWTKALSLDFLEELDLNCKVYACVIKAMVLQYFKKWYFYGITITLST